MAKRVNSSFYCGLSCQNEDRHNCQFYYFDILDYESDLPEGTMEKVENNFSIDEEGKFAGIMVELANYIDSLGRIGLTKLIIKYCAIPRKILRKAIVELSRIGAVSINKEERVIERGDSIKGFFEQYHKFLRPDSEGDSEKNKFHYLNLYYHDNIPDYEGDGDSKI